MSSIDEKGPLNEQDNDQHPKDTNHKVPEKEKVDKHADASAEAEQADAKTENEQADAKTENEQADAKTETGQADAKTENEQADAKTENEQADAKTETGQADARTETEQADSRGGLLDDHAEKKINDAYDDDVDHEAPDDLDVAAIVEEEEEEEEEEDPREGSVNYSLLSQDDLVKLMKEKLDHPARGNLRKEVDGIRSAYFDKQKQINEEKKQLFLEEGGTIEDFKPVPDPLDEEMKELLKKYRGLKAEFSKQLEQSKQENLKRKQDILEQFRVLMEGQESFENTFRKFKELQRQWFAAGVVPQSYLKDLWNSYNYFVEKFNDYVRINRELRALDLKKNLELKTRLCEQTEELEQEKDVVRAFKTLQKYHSRWREIGPVPRDNRDDIWERFKAASTIINRKHQELHSRMKEGQHENLEKKIVLCEQVEGIASKEYNSHGAWVDKTRQVLDIQKNWKTIGYAPKKDNNAVYARFRKACDQFFEKKAAYYAGAYSEQKENLKLKSEIVERAESLKDSQDWKGTSGELIRLQKKWKEIGPVPRKDSDRLWKRFRSACDTFFNNKAKFFEDVDSTFDDNLKAKEKIVAEMDAFAALDDRAENLKALEEFQQRFSEIGYVPSQKKDWIKNEFRQAQDRLLDRIGMDQAEQSIFRFKNRIRGNSSSPRAEMKLNFERDKLVTKLQQQKSEIGVLENNIGFFRQSDSSDDTIRGFQEKIDAAHERIETLEMKIRILDDMENAN